MFASCGNLAGNIYWYCERGFLDNQELLFAHFRRP